MNIVDYVVNSTNKYLNEMPKKIRKKKGQFFTSKETALFMASMFSLDKDKEEISILDPGAGTGILSAAMIQHIENNYKIKKIKITCYETDEKVLSLLQKNLTWISNNSSLKIIWQIITENYITTQKNEYINKINKNNKKYDLVISNPPYMKIRKDALESEAMPDICYGSPNLYFLFVSMALFNLKDENELVFIIPRSWTSGAYFKKFRENLFKNGRIEWIHLFISRDKVFENETVLQETIIIKIKKTKIKAEDIIITTTKSNSDFSDLTTFKTSYETVVCKSKGYVYLITNKKEEHTLQIMNKWSDTLLSLGLKMKTGLTVDFRHKDSLRKTTEENAVPLFYSQHISNGNIIFPIGKEAEYILTDKKGLIQDNKNYLFVKRFTSKEEKRRLQAAVYIAKNFLDYKKISTHNKLNFVTCEEGLSDSLVYGLYVLFNSSLYDCFYRILNGSTQVNSTEINSMPFPPLEIIDKIGKDIMISKCMTEKCCDKILGKYLNE